ncbi:MAG: hypothetical protein P0120_17580 [Nitrospira sp.]|nr:hypothetical protein [Nitrospira sp.]
MDQAWYEEEAGRFVKWEETTIAAAVAVGKESFQKEMPERENKGDSHV